MRAMLPRLFASALLLAVPAFAAEPGDSNVDLPRFPAISPDGSTVVFSHHGDLWSVGIGGGTATRLTAHPADDLQSRFNDDGTRLAFTSDRRGLRGLYAMNPDGTGVDELLVVDRASYVTDFTGGAVYFTGFLEPDVYRSPRPYKVGAGGGVHERVHDAFGRTPVREPGGERVLFVRGDSGWDRRHSRNPDTRDVWLFEDGGFTRLTEWPGNDGRPRWAGAGGEFVFASDREDETVNLYLADADDGTRAGENARRLTGYDDLDVEDFDVTPDGRTLVFARWDSLYSLDLTADDAEPKKIPLRAAEDEGDEVEYVNASDKATEAALSPDGKTMAMVAYGRVYVRATDDLAATRRVTDSAARHKQIAWSPDGGTLYFVSDETGRDAIYAATVALTRDDVKENLRQAASPATRPASRPANEEKSAPNPERWPDALALRVEPVSDHADGDSSPVPSPDGRHLAVTRGVGDLVVIDLETGRETIILDGWSSQLEYQWSPDSRHLLYAVDDADFNTDVWATRADGTGTAVNLTRHPDNDGLFSLSADGRVLAFASERVNEEYDVWFVYLDESLEALTPAELEQYHKDLAEWVKKAEPIDVPAFAAERGTVSPKAYEPPTGLALLRRIGREWAEIAGNTVTAIAEQAEADPLARPDVADLDDLPLETAYLRLRRVSREPGNEWNVTLLPDASAIYYTSDGKLIKKPWDGDATPAGSAVDVQGVTPNAATLAFVNNGKAGTQATGPGDKREAYAAEDRLEIDLADGNERKFRELARVLGDQFYHPTMKGLDWPALTERYVPLARAARTGEEFEHVANKFLGELNASHLGVYAPGEDRPARRAFGRLGVRTVPAEDGFEVVEVLETGPAGVGPMAMRVGDVVTAIDLNPVDLDRPLEVQLADRVGDETVVTVRRDGRPLNLLLTPADYGTIAAETYDSWRLANLRKVEELSDGRLGYIHVRGMDQGSLDVFERDLYAAAQGKDGLVIDVRNNGGGWTTDRLLASIMYPRHAYTIPRGMREGVDANRANLERGGYPQDRLFIQRYTLPVNMLANENSFSNAEIIAHAFKQLGRGTLVGETTAGGVISTGGFSLVDGTSVRLPFRGWYTLDGTDMENHGAVPDLRVEQTPEAEAAGEDEQLAAAVADLLDRLPPAE